MRRLTRSRHDRWFAGVMGGLAEYLGVPSTLLRILYVLISPFGAPILCYILLALIIPDEW